MIFGSVCSGIEAASVAWDPLGYKAAWLAEIEPFPSAVLAHHWPQVPNLGDMTLIAGKVQSGEVAAPDMLVGGTPCQAFSVAGLRGGLSDNRGFLTVKFVELADAIDSKRTEQNKPESIIVWENVPGVLSSKDNAFGCFLAALAGEDEELQPAGGKWSNAGCVLGPQRAIAWRVLDAQYFGVAQRRRRVFVVASARAGFDPTEVLFEFNGVRRDIAPSREKGQEVAGTLASRTGAGGFPGTDEACSGYLQPVGYRMTAFGEYAHDETASTMKARDYKDATDLAVCLRASSGGENAICYNPDQPQCWRVYDPKGISPTLQSAEGRGNAIYTNSMQVRRLTPIECERLQGFPDNHTLIPDWYECCGIAFAESLGKYGCANCNGDNAARLKQSVDGHRYKALGNSMAVPVMRWIGERIMRQISVQQEQVDAGSNAVLAERIVELTNERDAALAQLVLIRDAISAVRDSSCTKGFGYPDASQVKAQREAWQQLNEALEATPAQCLVEIKAQAGRDGFIAGLEYPDKVRFEGATRNPVFAADAYANQLRQQAKDNENAKK